MLNPTNSQAGERTHSKGQIESHRQHGVAIYGESGTEIIRIQPTDDYEADKALALKVSRLLFPIGTI